MIAIISLLFILHLQVNSLEASSLYNYDFSHLGEAPTFADLVKVHKWWMVMKTPTGDHEDDSMIEAVFESSTYNGMDVTWKYYNDTSCGHHKTSKSHYVDYGSKIMSGLKDLFMFHCTEDRRTIVIASMWEDYETGSDKMKAFMLAPWGMKRKDTDKIMSECLRNMWEIENFYFILLDRPCSATDICLKLGGTTKK